MSRLLSIATTLLIAASGVSAGCHGEKAQPMAPDQPLPPASGTAVGYLIDNAGALKLDEQQLEKLKKIDNSLAVQNDALDTQIREIEVPTEAEEAPDKHETEIKSKNWAPGATEVHTTQDSGKLHEAHAQNTQDALTKAFAVLDAQQQKTALKLLADRGIKGPKTTTTTTTTGGTETKTSATESDTSDSGEAPRGEP